MIKRETEHGTRSTKSKHHAKTSNLTAKCPQVL